MKRIPRSLIYAAATLFPLAALAVAAPKEKQPFTLTLAAPKQPLKAGQPLLLCVTVTNTLDHEVDVPTSVGADVLMTYKVEILDERGRPAPPWVPPPAHKGKTFLRIGSARTRHLQPGESYADQLDFTHDYDLTRPGKYNVWVALPFFRGPHLPNGLVRSNRIKVTVAR